MKPWGQEPASWTFSPTILNLSCIFSLGGHMSSSCKHPVSLIFSFSVILLKTTILSVNKFIHSSQMYCSYSQSPVPWHLLNSLLKLLAKVSSVSWLAVPVGAGPQFSAELQDCIHKKHGRGGHITITMLPLDFISTHTTALSCSIVIGFCLSYLMDNACLEEKDWTLVLFLNAKWEIHNTHTLVDSKEYHLEEKLDRKRFSLCIPWGS